MVDARFKALMDLDYEERLAKLRADWEQAKVENQALVVDRILFSLAKTAGLTQAEKEEIDAQRFNVREEFLPERLRDHLR